MPVLVDVDFIDTAASTNSVDEEGQKVALRTFKYGEYTWDEVKTRVYQIRDTAHPLCDINISNIS